MTITFAKFAAGRTRDFMRPAFLQGNAGTSGLGFLNLLPAQVTTGCFSFLRSLVQNPQKSASGIFRTLFFAPVLSSACFHDRNMQQEQERGHGKSIHKHG